MTVKKIDFINVYGYSYSDYSEFIPLENLHVGLLFPLAILILVFHKIDV